MTNTFPETQKGCLIDVINIKNKREWYHIRSNACFLIILESVFLGIMLIADDIKDGVDYNEDSLFFSSCKALYIDYDNLISHETNQRNFIEFYKPKELVMQNFYFNRRLYQHNYFNRRLA